jgi:hypothetical protein
VLQTRARYYLFIPWCYQTVNASRQSGLVHRDRGRGNERALIKALRASEASDKTGLIGARAGVKVRNLPSDVYWSGMIRYGVREHRGAIGSLILPNGPSEGATEMAERIVTKWNRTIPPVPAGFPEAFDEDFALKLDEATWLRDRIVAATEGTLLAHVLDRGELLADEVTAPWLAAPESQFEELHHARLFSAVMQGAALLYNLLIAERYANAGLEEEGEDGVGEYEERLQKWHQELLGSTGSDLASWDVERMWELIKGSNPNIQRGTEGFVNMWISGLRATDSVADQKALRALVEQRERRKGAQSRLKNEKMLAAWSGASGTGRLVYRWGSVKVIINDIIRGLDDAGA